MNILVIKPSSLGDIIHTFPAVRLIRQRFPEATIFWVANAGLVGAVDLSTDVDEVVPFPRRRLGQWCHCLGVIDFVKELRQRRYDVALDFQGLLRSGLMARASGAPVRVGFRDAREGATLFYTDKVLLPANCIHAIDRNVFLVRSAFDLDTPLELPELKAQHDFLKCARRLLADHDLDGDGPLLAVGPAARWNSKRWPPAFFARVLDQVADAVPDVRIWALGSQDEAADTRDVLTRCQTATPVSLAGETNLGTLAELLRASSVLLTNDSGPMHMAAALGTPTVALFGPTDPQRTGPYGDDHRVFRGECRAAPCFAKTCPLERQVCLHTVDTGEVGRHIVRLMETDAGAAVTPATATESGRNARPEEL